ncbi:Uncharacterised protein [Prevotella melaninogenica]|nr:Uncharacterised protein [Prevotella melaninogenica]
MNCEFLIMNYEFLFISIRTITMKDINYILFTFGILSLQ